MGQARRAVGRVRAVGLAGVVSAVEDAGVAACGRHPQARSRRTTWEDLRDDYQTSIKRSGKPWTFDEIRTRVSMDFSVNGKALVGSSETLAHPAFRVIWLSDGTDSHFQSHEPNTMILNYLNGIARPQPVLTGFGGSAKG